MAIQRMTTPSRIKPPCQFMQVPSRCLSLELAVSNFSGLLLHFLYKFNTTHDLRTREWNLCQAISTGGIEGSKRNMSSSIHLGSENRTMMECSALCSIRSQTSYFTAYTLRIPSTMVSWTQLQQTAVLQRYSKSQGQLSFPRTLAMFSSCAMLTI